MLMSVLLQVLPHLTIWISIQVLIPVPHQVLIQFYPVFWFLCRTKLQSLYFLSYIWSSNLRYRYCSFFPLKMLLPNISSVANKQNIGLRTFPQVFFLLQVYFQVLWIPSLIPFASAPPLFNSNIDSSDDDILIQVFLPLLFQVSVPQAGSPPSFQL